MLVRDILESNRAAETIGGSRSIYEAIVLMAEAGVGSLIVINENDHPIGIMTESDICRTVLKYRGNIMDLPVGDNMSSGLIMGVLDDELEFVAEIMTNNNIQHMPIMDTNERLCGVISARDIIGAFVNKKKFQKQTSE